MDGDVTGPERHLWDVQGSYFHPVEGHGKGGYRVNARVFVLASTLEIAVAAWKASRPEILHAEVHQVIRRSTASQIIYGD